MSGECGGFLQQITSVPFSVSGFLLLCGETVKRFMLSGGEF